MLFNKSGNYDFPQEFSLNGDILECLEKTKLLGIYLTPELRWKENCHEIYMKAMSKIWLLRRLKMIDFDIDLILDFYFKDIRPLTEHSVAV